MRYHVRRLDLGIPLTTPYNRHRLERRIVDGSDVVVKSYNPSSKRCVIELWARRRLDVVGASVAPRLVSINTSGSAFEVIMEYLEPDEHPAVSGEDGWILKLGALVAEYHCKCRSTAGELYSILVEEWLHSVSRSVKGCSTWEGFRYLDLNLLVERLQTAVGLAPLTLIHRDLTPENILFSGGRPYIIDWEMATMGHPDLDLARLSLVMTQEEAKILRTGYQAEWSRHALWESARWDKSYRGAFILLYCAEMVEYLIAAGQNQSDFSKDLVKLAQSVEL